MAMNDIEIPPQEMTNFCNALRESRLGTGIVQSNRSLERYQERHGQITAEQLRQNFSDILIECFQIETEIFREIADDIRRFWVHDLLEFQDRHENFPNISNLVDQTLLVLDENNTNEQKLSDIIRILHRINDGVSFSMKQSGKSRAGGAFENYVEIFFRILDFEQETQITIQGGEVLDFVLPSHAFVLQRQEDSIWLECQTSLRDRFRLSIGKTSPNTQNCRKFVATMAGLNLLNLGDDRDLFPNMINQILIFGQPQSSPPWVVIALRQVAEDRNSPTVISFEQFVNQEYPRISATWNI